jgi:prophage maintenance system killer protein
MAAYIFLGLNGRDLDADEPEVVAMMEGVAAGRISKAVLANWFRATLRALL